MSEIVIGLGGRSVQLGFQFFHACLDNAFVGIGRDANWVAVGNNTSGPGKRQHKSVPAAKHFASLCAIGQRNDGNPGFLGQQDDPRLYFMAGPGRSIRDNHPRSLVGAHIIDLPHECAQSALAG